MNRQVKKILFGLILIFLMIQMIRPARNIDYGQLPSSDISKIYQVPPKVQSILRTSCYDCHSNSTDYPVYSYIQPLGFYLENHIKKGKKELNFNEWGHYSQRKQANKLEAIAHQVTQNKMPLPSYLYFHENAKLSKEKVEEIVNWIESIPTENKKGE